MIQTRVFTGFTYPLVVSQKKPKVLCAMSGGVDSSVAAALLIERGYEVVGCFMRLGSPGESIDEMVPAEDAAACRPLKIGHQGCCSINDAADARLVAAQLGIAFYVCNFKKDFGRIIDYFVDEYASGRTPNPCVRCNDWLKFGKLHEYAKQIDADYVASGHYAQVESSSDGRGERMLISGVNPITRPDEILRISGLGAQKFNCCVDLGYSALDTIGNANETKAWAGAKNYDSLIIVTASYHMPRSLAELRRVMPATRLISHPVMPRGFRQEAWWLHIPTTRILLSEYLKFLPSAARFAAARVLGPWDGSSVAAMPSVRARI